MSDIKVGRVRRWMFAGAWTALIYSTLSIVRPVCEFFKQYAWFSPGVNAGLAFSVALLAAVFIRKKYLRKPSSYVLLIVVIGLYLAGIAALSIPEERIHFLEYGVLAFLVYRALAVDLKDGHAYLAAWVITSLLGLGDEGIQYLLPNRYYQFQDVCLNAASAALGLALAYVIRRERGAGGVR